MTEPRTWTQGASDGYPIRVTSWTPVDTARGQLVVLHGVQSHAGWYHNLGRTLCGRGFEAHFPDRRGSGSNHQDRGHASSSGRLIRDLTELLTSLRRDHPGQPAALAGISWGGKLAVVTAATAPALVDALALICPGLQPRVGVSRSEKVRIAIAALTNRRKRFPIPLSDPALFTDHEEGRAFIAADPLGLREATASLLAASSILDLRVARALRRVRQPALLMLAGRDRIVDNERTLDTFGRLASTEKRVIEYPDGHHTLEFEPDPSRYALDLADWLESALPKR
jgi:alpha-beta hydrolase superfamily lysophospholipase